MKKIFLLVFSFFVALNVLADRTFSFGQISSYCPQTGMMNGGGAVISLTVGDGYIIHPLYGKMMQGQTNYDGSVAYYPSGYAGTPMAQLQGILLSANLQTMEEHLTSSYGGMTIQMINTYTNAGEDGGRYANTWSSAMSASNDHSHDTNHNSGTCSRCHGTGIDPTCIDTPLPSHKTGSDKIPAYTKCPYCNQTKSFDHWHWRCIECRP